MTNFGSQRHQQNFQITRLYASSIIFSMRFPQMFSNFQFNKKDTIFSHLVSHQLAKISY